MLSSPVYTKPHPRRDAVHAASQSFPVSSKSFRSYPFRTLASHFQTGVSSNLFEINRLRTLCKIPGIGYPPPSLFLGRHSIRSPLFPAIHPFSLQPFTKCSSSNSFVLTTIHFHGGCIPPLKWNAFPQAVAVPLRSNRNALISFLFPPLQTFSFTTREVHPSRPRVEDQNETRTPPALLPVAQAHRTLQCILPSK
jgi:hypothetical protein